MRKNPASTLFLACLALTACGQPNAELEGAWTLDREAFIRDTVPVLREAGKIPEGAEAQARRLLGRVKMELEIEPDKSFSCRMSTATETSLFTGTWSRGGKHVTILQSHKDGEPEEDSMNGVLDGDTIRFEHDEEGLTVIYTLQRKSVAAPR